MNNFLLFPIVFIFHDMEEIVGMKQFLMKNEEKLERSFPKMMRIYSNFSTEAFAVAVYEELIVCVFLSVAAMLIDNKVLTLLWIGAFAGCTLHFAIHIVQGIVIRTYIPALITSCICLPVSVWVIAGHVRLLGEFSAFQSAICLTGIVLVFANLAFAHRIMKLFANRS